MPKHGKPCIHKKCTEEGYKEGKANTLLVRKGDSHVYY